MKQDSVNMLESVLKPITDPLNYIASNNDLKLESKMTGYDALEGESLCVPKCSSISNKEKNSNKTLTNVEVKGTPSENESNGAESSEDILSDDSFQSTSSQDKQRESISSNWSISEESFKNVPFGVRIERGNPMIGKSRISMTDGSIVIDGVSYKKSPGLIELLLKKTPDLSMISTEDKLIYKEILEKTNAHRRDFDSKKPIKSNKGQKYVSIIKPLFKLPEKDFKKDSESVGYGLPILKKLRKYTDYVYWDDPNELVDRLRLLLATRDAGNTGVDNEIISIIEELRESGILN